ncbi:MAG: leucine-rich repeat protein [Kiritimatiellae bacterium]|nr:leucine-rich repeat protein [Kiritimatiellia bacterium]
MAFLGAPESLAETATVNGVTWTYTVSGGKASIDGDYGYTPAVPSWCTGTISIPSKLGGYPVTEIGDYAFYRCGGLKSVTIPNSVTNIGTYAFSKCNNLTQITIPNSVKGIGSHAFYECEYLTQITIPNSIRSIGDGAFNGCKGLRKITIPNSVVNIGSGTFALCNGLTNVTIPNSVTYIGSAAFSFCTGLKSMTIPDSVRSIGESAFNECIGLRSLAIPNSVTNIGQYTFHDCSGLQKVTIGSGATSINPSAFDGCHGLENIGISSKNANYASEDGVLFSKDKKTLVRYPCGKNGAYAIPSSVKRIGKQSFYGCSNLTNVTIPDGVTDIELEAFVECPRLTELTLPISVTNLARLKVGVVSSLATSSGVRSGSESSGNTIRFGPFGIGLKTLYVPKEWYGTAMLEDIVPDGCKVVYVVHVSFNANGGTVSPAGKTMSYGEKVGVLPTPKRTGYKFLGWYTAASGGSKVDANTKIVKDRIFHAHWQAIPYTVKFNANGGSGKMAAQTIAYGKTARLRKNAFKRAGFTFAGWAKSRTGKVEYANRASVKNLRSDGKTVTLFARWARPAYTVAFNANGGKGKMAAQRMAYGKAAKLARNAFSRQGWVFLGWATAKNGTVAYADAATVKNLRTNGKIVTLYAIWEKGQPVRFDANGGSCAVSEKVFRAGHVYGTFPTPEWPWHTFLGWYTAADGGEWVSPMDIAEGTTTRELHAHWEYLPLKLGTASQSVGPLAAKGLSVPVSTKTDWTAAADAGWLSVRTKNGRAGDGKLVYDVAANTGNARTGRIIVSAGGKALLFTVTQQARTLKLSASKKVFSKNAATGQKLGVTATVSWKAKSSAGWLKLKTASGKGNATIVYELAENKGAGRAATIAVTGGGKTASFRVEQKGKDGSDPNAVPPTVGHFLQIDPANVTYSAEAVTNETALVMSDLPWTATTTNDWISLSGTNGSGFGMLTYQVAANTDNHARTGTVTVAGGTLKAELILEQKGKADEPPYLALSPTNRTAGAAAASNEAFWVEANVAWEVAVSDDWIDVNPSSGSGNGRVAYTMAANPSTDGRTGTVTVYGGGLAGVFTLTQAGKAAAGTGSGSGAGSGSGTIVAPAEKKLAVHPSARSHGNEAASDAFQVESNVKWAASPSENWIVLDTKSGTSNGIVKYSVARNTGDQRTGTITLKGGGLETAFAITQGGTVARPPRVPAQRGVLAVIPDTIELPDSSARDLRVSVITPTPGFAWKASVPTTPWIHLKTTAGTGPGPLGFHVDENPDTWAQRFGYIYVRYPQVRCKIIQPPKVAVLTVSPTNHEVSWKGGTKTSKVTANVDWHASVNVDWISLKLAKTANGGTVSIAVEGNPDPSPRQGVVTVTGGGLARKIFVNQEKTTILLVSPTNKTHSCKADWGELGVRANVKWSASRNADWIVLKKVAGKGSANAHQLEYIRYDVKANNSTNARTGTITVSGGGKSVKVFVKQAAKPFLTVTPMQTNLPFKAASGKLRVKSNVGWSVTRDKSWITPGTAMGKGNGTLVFTVAKNTNGVDRTGHLVVRGGGISRTITIGQKKEPVLKIEPKSKTYEGGSFSTWFYVTADMNWRTSCDAAWVTLRTASGRGNGLRNGGHVDFDVAANKTGSNRTARITVSGGGKTAVFTLTQKADRPNLCFYKPSGWPAAVFVTADETSTSRQTTFTAGQLPAPCIRYAWKNAGGCKAGMHTIERDITVDGRTSVGTSEYDELETGQHNTSHIYFGLSDDSAVYAAPAKAGTYTASITLDSENEVNESNENDNVTNVTFTVVSSYSYSTAKRSSAKKSDMRAVDGPATLDAGWIAVTASGNADAGAVVDGDETTAWEPNATNGAWVVLTFSEPREVEDVEVVGENLPGGTRFLLSEDADHWQEGVPGTAQYVWVIFPAGDVPPVVREIRLAP